MVEIYQNQEFYVVCHQEHSYMAGRKARFVLCWCYLKLGGNIPSLVTPNLGI